jgi:hypothetical protein
VGSARQDGHDAAGSDGQNVSETDRTPYTNAFFVGISFPRFQSNRARNFSEASVTKNPANISGSTCCIPDPVGLNPCFPTLPLDNEGPGVTIRESRPKSVNFQPLHG